MSVAPPTRDLAGCEAEPVHLPGSIQPHGLLLVLDPGNLTIVAASDNAPRFVGLAAADLIGRPVGSLAIAGGGEPLEAALRHDDLEARNPFELVLRGVWRVDAVAHRHGGHVLLEAEPVDRGHQHTEAQFYSRVRRSLVRLRATQTMQELFDHTVRELRALTGFDRVVMYRFRPDWAGEVVAESARDEPRYLGLRFPASDIPSQARALYTACRLRTVMTSTYAPAALVGRDGLAPVDLTHATLRSVSPVHLEYMRNMGVTASMGISLIIDQHLWGLITCNHESGEWLLPYRERTGCAAIGEVAACLIGQQALLDASQAKLAALSTQTSLLHFIAKDRDVVTGLTRHSPSLLDVVAASGAALAIEGELHCLGATPPASELPALLRWLDAHAQPCLTFESLPARYPAAQTWRAVGCGLLAARIAFGDSMVVSRAAWLLWFRPEVAQTVAWGGDPNKVVADPQARLHPRISFARWRETVDLQAEPFTPDERAAAASLVEALGDAILEHAATRKLQAAARLLEDANRRLVQQVEETLRAEVELRRAQKLEAVGRLAAGIAHEINTPLQFINDSIQFVSDAIQDLLSLVPTLPLSVAGTHADVDLDYLKCNLPIALQRSRGGLVRVSMVVDALQEFAQPDAVDKSPADVNHALELTVAIARTELKDRTAVTLELGDVPVFPCFVGHLNQLFLNLIINAAEAIATREDGGARGAIVIRSRCDGTDALVTISDDGPGIPEAIRESVFLPFFTTKEVGKGSGQGLAVSHAIAMKHGGSLTFESTLGRGTTFTVRLPMA